MRDRIDSDEEVELFRTFATERDDGGWDVRVHGWIYEPEADSRMREALYAVLQGALDRMGITVADSGLTRSRVWPFLVDNERGEHVPITVGEGGAASVGSEAGNEAVAVAMRGASVAGLEVRGRERFAFDPLRPIGRRCFDLPPRERVPERPRARPRARARGRRRLQSGRS